MNSTHQPSTLNMNPIYSKAHTHKSLNRVHNSAFSVLFYFFIMLILFFVGCSGAESTSTPKETPYESDSPDTSSSPALPPIPDEIDPILSESGTNRSEFEEAIHHYYTMNQMEKLDALYFLIENLPKHGYAQFELVNEEGDTIPWDVLDYIDYSEMVADWDRLEEEYGNLEFKTTQIYYDIHHITKELLTAHIDQAFYAWRNFPWSQAYSKQQFYQYILPYRGSGEPLSNWRSHFIHEFAGTPEAIAALHEKYPSLIELATYINTQLAGWFAFDSRFYRHPTDQGLASMVANQLGRCEDMSNLAIYAFRSLGLACTSDYVPYWPDSGNNHAWNVLILPDNTSIPFMGCSTNPGEYDLGHEVAKAYRKTFALQKNSLKYQLSNQTKAPKWLGGVHYEDVTDAYTETDTITIQLPTVPDGVSVAYLSVFNSGYWKAIAWAPIQPDNTANFSVMGTHVAYLPSYYIDEKIQPAHQAFIFAKTKEVHWMNGYEHSAPDQQIHLDEITHRIELANNDDVSWVQLEPNSDYSLFMWQDEWVAIHEIKYEPEIYPSGIHFNELYPNTLYWFKKNSGPKDARIFTIQNNKMSMW